MRRFRSTVVFPIFILYTLIVIRMTSFISNLSPRERFLAKSVFVHLNEEESARLRFSNNCVNNATEFRFRPENGLVAKNTFSNAWIGHLCQLGLLNRSFRSTTTVYNSNPVFVTAFSTNHIHEGIDLLSRFESTLKKEAPSFNVTFYLYDLGLKRSYVRQFQKQYSHFLIIRQFPFQHYPSYIANLKEYRWKPLIVADVLKTHHSLWWFDTSVRLWSFQNLTYYYEGIKKGTSNRYPLTFPFRAGHSIYPTTTAGLYDYFPISRENAINVDMMAAGIFLLFGTQSVIRDVLVWWTLCSLEKNCMAPVGHRLHCHFKGKGYEKNSKYANCHRYDQSALNILVTSANQYHTEKYALLNGAALSIETHI